MGWESVIQFSAPAGYADAAVVAAWCAAAEADGDWWGEGVVAPWLDGVCEPTPGEVLAGLAACRVPGGVAGGDVAGGDGACAPDPRVFGSGDLFGGGSVVAGGSAGLTPDARAIEPAGSRAGDQPRTDGPVLVGPDGTPLTSGATTMANGAGSGAATAIADSDGPTHAAAHSTNACGRAQPQSDHELQPDATADDTAAGAADAGIHLDDAASADTADAGAGPVAGWVRREWVSQRVCEEVRSLMFLPPGVELVAGLTVIGPRPVCDCGRGELDADLDVNGLPAVPGRTPGVPCACQLIIAAAWNAVESWAQVKTAMAVVDAASPEEVVSTPYDMPRARVRDSARTELAGALCLTTSGAAGRIATARDLYQFPGLVALAEAGVIIAPVWRMILAQTTTLPATARRRVVEAMITKLRTRHESGIEPWTSTEARAVLRRLILTLAAEEEAKARAAAYANRRVSVTPDSDGMVWMNIYLRDTDAHRIMNRVRAQAAALTTDHPDDDRTAGQRHVDIIIDTLLHPIAPIHTTDCDCGCCPHAHGDGGHGGGHGEGGWHGDGGEGGEGGADAGDTPVCAGVRCAYCGQCAHHGCTCTPDTLAPFLTPVTVDDAELDDDGAELDTDLDDTYDVVDAFNDNSDSDVADPDSDTDRNIDTDVDALDVADDADIVTAAGSGSDIQIEAADHDTSDADAAIVDTGDARVVDAQTASDDETADSDGANSVDVDTVADGIQVDCAADDNANPTQADPDADGPEAPDGDGPSGSDGVPAANGTEADANTNGVDTDREEAAAAAMVDDGSDPDRGAEVARGNELGDDFAPDPGIDYTVEDEPPPEEDPPPHWDPVCDWGPHATDITTDPGPYVPALMRTAATMAATNPTTEHGNSAADRCERGSINGVGSLAAGGVVLPLASRPRDLNPTGELCPEATPGPDLGRTGELCPDTGTDRPGHSQNHGQGQGQGRGQTSLWATTGPVPREARAEITVVVDLATLLHLADNPAEVPGLGTIPPDTARELAADGKWRLLVTDPATRTAVATSARTYTPTAAVARLVRGREPTCRAPGCNRQAVNCDLDHTLPWPHGDTTVQNLGPLCRTHHNLKTHHGYNLTATPANPDTGTPLTWTWTYPSGLTHTRTAQPPLDH